MFLFKENNITNINGKLVSFPINGIFSGKLNAIKNVKCQEEL